MQPNIKQTQQWEDVDGLMWWKLSFPRHLVHVSPFFAESVWPSDPRRYQTLASGGPRLYRCFDSALIPPTQILPCPLYSVIKVILIQKLHFPHPSPIIISEAYFKCRVINHVMVEAPPGLWACSERFPFTSGRLLLVSSHLKSTSHTVNHLAFVEGKSNLHNKLLWNIRMKIYAGEKNLHIRNEVTLIWMAVLRRRFYLFYNNFTLSSSASFCHLHNLFLWSSFFSGAESISYPPPAPTACCHLQTSLKVRKVGVWAANHWLQLPDHLGKNMCGEMNE